MLSDEQRVAYERDGVIVVPEVFSPAEIEELRRVTDEFVRNAASVAANDEIYDLEDSHSARDPLYLEFVHAITQAQLEEPDLKAAAPAKATWRERQAIATDIAKRLLKLRSSE